MALLARLRRAGYTGWVEEEQCDAYRSTMLRLRAAGWNLDNDHLNLPACSNDWNILGSDLRSSPPNSSGDSG